MRCPRPDAASLGQRRWASWVADGRDVNVARAGAVGPGGELLDRFHAEHEPFGHEVGDVALYGRPAVPPAQ